MAFAEAPKRPIQTLRKAPTALTSLSSEYPISSDIGFCRYLGTHTRKRYLAYKIRSENITPLQQVVFPVLPP